MRYRKLSQCGTHVQTRYVFLPHIPCVAQQLADALQHRFPAGSGGALASAPYRLVGHSLGSQVVIRAASLMAEAKRAEVDAGGDASFMYVLLASLVAGGGVFVYVVVRGRLLCSHSPPSTDRLPTRIALLDPFFTMTPKAYLGWRTLPAALTEAMEGLREDERVVFEVYKTSVLSHAAANTLRAHAAYFDVQLPHIPWWKLRSRHVAAPYIYFMSFAVGVDDRLCGCIYIYIYIR